jgi:hypothetical protein
MEANAFHAAIVQRIAKWELMLDGMPNEAKTLCVHLALVAEFAQQFAQEAY